MKNALPILFTLIVLALCWWFGIWALSLETYDAPEFFIFLGRLHPLILHLPIGFTALALMIDFGRLLPEKWREGLPKTTWLYGLIFLATTGTVVHGILLYISDDFMDSELASRHLIGGCTFLSVIALIFILKLSLSSPFAHKITGFPMAALAMIILSFSSHDGASLTHGENYLSKYAPAALKPLLAPAQKPYETISAAPASTGGDPQSVLGENIYAAAIQPIFDRTCVECHKESKKKGRLRMDTHEELMKGGASGDFLEPGNLKDSLFIELMRLPLDDEEHMPPEGKKQPTSEEVKILEWWVLNGAPAEGTLSSHNPPAEIISAIQSIEGGE